MRTIDMQTWSRREHFELYRKFDHPHFGLCANVDITQLRRFTKEHAVSLNVAIIYLVTRVANDIPEFRYRILGDEVIEHEVVHPSSTILASEDLFSFCTFDYTPRFPTFAKHAEERIAYVKEHPFLKDPPGTDNLLFMTSIPWVSFTSFTHPMNFNPPDSVPRFAWGKFFEENGVLKMPLAVQGHHALMDGVHIGKYYEKFQEYLSHPEMALE
jgi:chloramphenicol O-acetyltransferase type A